MEENLKQLLLKDLCARFPYGVILNVTLIDKYDKLVTRDIKLSEGNLTYITSNSHWLEYRPYLRSMAKMTEVERAEYSRFSLSRYNTECFDWLNKHHFDYRGLIEKGLALEAPKGMYN